MFFALFLKHQKESMKEKKKSKKTKLNTEHGNRLSIILDNYDSDIFRTFLLFVHCGSIRMNATNVTGRYYLSSSLNRTSDIIKYSLSSELSLCNEIT